MDTDGAEGEGPEDEGDDDEAGQIRSKNAV